MVEDQGRGQFQPCGGDEAVPEAHGGQRVEAEVLEGAVRVDGVGTAVAEHGGDVFAYQVGEVPRPFRLGEPGERGLQRRRAGGGAGTVRGGDPPCGRGHQPAQQGGQCRALGAQGRRVEPDGEQQRLVAAEGGVEQGEALFRGEAEVAGARQARGVRVREVAGESGALLPEAPGKGCARPALGPPVGGERVEEGVGGGVAGLARVVERPGEGGEEHEGGQVAVGRELVQVPRGVHLGAEHGSRAFRSEGGDRPVVEYAGCVYHGGERVCVGYPVEHPCDRVAVGGVAGGDGHLCPVVRELGAELRCTRRLLAAPADEHQVAHAVSGHEVPGDDGAEHARATGEEDGAFGVQLSARGPGGCSGVVLRVRTAGLCGCFRLSRRYGTDDARGVHPARAHRELFLSRLDRGEHVSRRNGLIVEVEQDESAGLLALGRPYESPDPCRRQTGDVLALGGHGAAGHDHEPGVRELLVGEQALHLAEHLLDGAVHAVRDRLPDVRGDGQEDGGRRVRHGPVVRAEGCGESEVVGAEHGTSGACGNRGRGRGARAYVPRDAVQRVLLRLGVASGCPLLHDAGHQRLDGGDRGAGRVGDLDGDGVLPRGEEPYA